MSATTMPISLFERFSVEHPHWSDDSVMRAIARHIVEEGQVTPPVDVELLSSLCGIADIETRPAGPSGMLVKKKRGWVASVLATEGLERQRFTILHEGGHTFLPGFGRKTEHRCKGPRTREEVLSDIAAAEMLLPFEFFKDDLGETGFGLSGVEELAPEYEASIQATALRAVDTWAEPAILIVLSERHKPSERGREDTCEPKLRLDWAYSRGPWPYPLRDKSVASGSPLVRATSRPERPEIADLDELFADSAGELEVSAAWYGDNLLALARRPAEGDGG